MPTGMAEQMKKRCLYDVLSVSRDCSQEEIRSAYKRLALQLHPDKLAQSGASNASGDATAAFQELLHAYEVLSDPKERAWYDSHRSQILFSDPSSASKSRSSFFDLDLFFFFSKAVYSGFTDSGKGFFKVYGDVFAKIYAQELNFAEKLGLSSDVVAPAPLIGNLDSPYSQVTAFYGYWLGYSTVMDFAWVDEYDSFAGPNRKARRLMEEENKKLRKKAKREHNETVRGLAAFVKKRDKRVLDMQMKKNEEEEKRRAEEKERKKEEERKKKERAMLYQEPEWAKNDQEESKMIWDDDENDKRRKKGKGDVEMYCVVCNKKFKSEKQWKNHEQSKKHREKVTELRSAFDDEDEALKDVGQEGLCVSFDYEPQAEDNESSEGDADKLSEAFKDDLTLQNEGDNNGNLNVDDLLRYVQVAGSDNDNGIGNTTDYHELESHRNCRNHRAKGGTGRDDVVMDAVGASEVPESNVGHLEDFSASVEEASEITKEEQAVGKTLKLKKQQVDGQGPARKDTIKTKSSSKGKKQKAAAKTPNNNSCETCGESFDSRNKLFSHLSKTGHAMLKS